MSGIYLGWWSAGITSAVACKIALELFEDVQLYYIETGSAHADNARFKKDCEKWYGKEIITVRNSKGYKDHFDVIRRERYVNGPDGAKCSQKLKKDVRYEVQDWLQLSLFSPGIERQIFGYEFEKTQVNRAIRFLQQYAEAKALFPLIDKGLTKDHCAALLLNNGIELPIMYKLGYSNNNCEGCVKGGMGYWNNIRVDFPARFDEMAKVEREIGRSCIEGVFLDELAPGRGRVPSAVVPSCGPFCEVEFADLPDKSLEEIMAGKKSIYEAAL